MGHLKLIFAQPFKSMNNWTMIAFRRDGKMSKMHRRRKSRNGLSHLLLLLLSQNHQFEERVGVGKPNNFGHGAAAEPLCEGQLATVG